MKKHFLKDEMVKDCILSNEELVKEYLDIFFGKLFYYKKDVIYIDNNTFTSINKDDLKVFLFSNKTKGIFWNEYFDEKSKKVIVEYFVDYRKVYSYAKLNKLDNIVFEGVLFKTESVELDYKLKTLFVKVKNIIFKKDFKKIDENIKNEIIEDYKKHFPQLHEFLDFIVACRFTNNRKRSFLYLNAPSDWGKSFLMGIFKKIGIGLEIEYSDILKDKPVGLNAMSVLKSLVLFLDEFTTFKKELKKVTHYIFVEEKYSPKVEVEVYAKVLMSAEKSPSFIDTIETQIVNRVLMLEVKKDVEILTNRDIYKKYGNLMYFEAVKQYITDYLINKINYYLSKGEFIADKEAESVINSLFDKYRLKEIDLETYLIKFFADELLELAELKTESIDDLDFEIRKLLKYVDVVGVDKKIVFINNFMRFVDDLFKIKLDDTKRKSAEYKKTQLAQILFDVEKLTDVIMQKKINGKNKRVIKINIQELNLRYLKKAKLLELPDKKIEFDTFEDLAQKINDYIKEIIERDGNTNEIKETLDLWGLSSVFVFVTDKNNKFLGVELKGISPPSTDEFPF